MGSAVDLAELRDTVGRYGPLATVVTVADDLCPHVGTSMVEFEGDVLVIRVGQRTAGCLARHPPVDGPTCIAIRADA